MKKTLIRELWLSYRNEVIPANASSVQLIETRRAFYAGGRALLHAVTLALESGSDVTDGDLNMMQSIHEELEQFVKDVKNGVA